MLRKQNIRSFIPVSLLSKYPDIAHLPRLNVYVDVLMDSYMVTLLSLRCKYKASSVSTDGATVTTVIFY